MKFMNKVAIQSAMALALSSFASAQFQEVYRQEGSIGDEAGRSVAGIGDVDGDGVEDYAVGSPFEGPVGAKSGRVHVWSGKTGALIRIHAGDQDGDRFGWAIDGVGDINHDGRPDYAIGAPYWDWPDPQFPLTDCGKAYLYSGSNGAFMQSGNAGQSGALSGYSVCGVGDLNLDGTRDWAYSMPYGDFNGLNANGAVIVLMGGGTSIWQRAGAGSLDLFGWSMDSVGDITGDGRSELVVGAPNADAMTTNNGTGYVLNGADGSTVFARSGTSTNGFLGWAVAGVGDLSGDGKPDVAFGEPYSDANGTDSGRVLISSGASPSYPAFRVHIGVTGEHLGQEIAAIGDVDGDGRSDYVCCAPYGNFSGLVDAGWVYLFSGASGSFILAFIGEAAGDLLGISADGIGDLNGDGFADLIAGGPWSNVNGADSGLARVALSNVPPQDVYCTAKLNSAGCTPMIGHTGMPSLSIADDFKIGAQQILYNVPGIMIWSLAPTAVPFFGGTLCAAPPVKRTPGQSAGGVLGQPCSGTFEFHFSQAYMTTQALTAGTIVHAQYWSRDSGFPAPDNIGLTDALMFTLIP